MRMVWAALVLALGLGVALFMTAAHAADVVPSADEIRRVFVGKTVYARTRQGRFTISYSPSGEVTGQRGRDGGTEIFRGTYRIADGQICNDVTGIDPFCMPMLRDGAKYLFLNPRGERIYFEF